MNWFYIFGLFCFCFSCQNSNEITLSDEVLIALIKDLHVAESAASSYPNSEQVEIKKQYLAQICSIHNVSEKEIDINLQALYTEEDHYKMVYDSVISLLNAEEKSFYKASEMDVEDAKSDKALLEMEEKLKNKAIKKR